jgi:hypothetical protein
MPVVAELKALNGLEIRLAFAVAPTSFPDAGILTCGRRSQERRNWPLNHSTLASNHKGTG